MPCGYRDGQRNGDEESSSPITQKQNGNSQEHDRKANLVVASFDTLSQAKHHGARTNNQHRPEYGPRPHVKKFGVLERAAKMKQVDVIPEHCIEEILPVTQIRSLMAQTAQYGK